MSKSHLLFSLSLILTLIFSSSSTIVLPEQSIPSPSPQAQALDLPYSDLFPDDKSGLPACGLYIKDPSVLGLVYKRPMIPLKFIDYNLEIINGLVNVKMVQEYYNPSDKFLGVYFSFPINPNSAIYQMIAQFGNKRVQGVVKAKDQARSQYDKAVSEGKQAVLTEIDQFSKDIIRMQIGNIPPKTKVTISISFVQEMTLSVSTFYRIQILSSISPRYMNSVQGKYANQGEDNTTPYVVEDDLTYSFRPGFKWNFNIVLKAYRKINFYNSTTHELKVVKLADDGKEIVLTFREDSLPNRDFVFYYNTQDFHLPSYVIGKNYKTSTVMVSFIPKFSEVSVQDSYKLAKQNKSAEVDINSVKGEYIFILDRSGSMDDNRRIEKAKQALILFLKSLPYDSYFNVVSFGSQYSIMYPESQKNENSKIKQAIQKVDSMRADLGGTQIFEPLRLVLDQKGISEYPKFVFLLTDGQVSNTQGVIRMAKQKSRNARINTIGIGNGASVRLIQGCAQAGKGKYVMITDDQKPAQKIINLLQSAMTPLITKLTLNFPEQKVKSIIPNPKKLPYILKDNTANFYLIFNQLLKQPTKISLQYQDSVSRKVYKSEIEINPQQNSYGYNFVYKMAHFKVLRALEDLSHDSAYDASQFFVYQKEDEKNDFKKQAENYSVKNQILSEYTSFLAIVKQQTDKQSKQFKQVGVQQVVVKQPLVVQYQQRQQIFGPVPVPLPKPIPAPYPSYGKSASASFGGFGGATAGMMNAYMAPSIATISPSLNINTASLSGASFKPSISQASTTSSSYSSRAFSPPSPPSIPSIPSAPSIISKKSYANAAADQSQPPFESPKIPTPQVSPQQSLLQSQNTDGSWSDPTTLTQIFTMCNCPQQKSQLQAIISTLSDLRQDIIITKLALAWLKKKEIGGEYGLILKKGQGWLRRVMRDGGIDEARLSGLSFVI